MGSGFSKMKKQARLMQDQFSQVKQTLQQTTYNGTAGNGLVEVVIDGEKNLKKISINPECVNPSDVEGLQDLILAAFASALEKAAASESSMKMPW